MSAKVIVTDHALCRYLERVHGVDMEFFRACAASECEEAAATGATSVKIGDHWFIIKNRTLITVLDQDQHPKARDRKALKRAEMAAHRAAEREAASEAMA